MIVPLVHTHEAFVIHKALMAASVVIVNKRQKRKQDALAAEGYILIDVTNTSPDETFRKFSPFYPHGGIPYPGRGISTSLASSQSVEGIWQGLKVFQHEPEPDARKLTITNMKNLKRVANDKRGRYQGHMLVKTLVNYVTARKEIYIPAYKWVLKYRLADELELLRGMLAEHGKIALVDYNTNEDEYDTSSPLSHAGLIKEALLDKATET